MAYLLLMYQKMKLQREENQLTLKSIRFDSIANRMKNKTEKRRKYYDKLKRQLERQATAYKNSANIFFSNAMGLGTNGVNLNNMYGTSMAAINALSQWGDKDPMGNPISKEDIQIAQAYMAGQYEIDKETGAFKIKVGDTTKEIPKDGISKYQQIQNIANSQVTQMQSYASQMKNNYDNNVSIWLEAQQEQLEAQEEWEMDLLAEEEADITAEKDYVDIRLKSIQEQKKNIQSALDQAIQESAPKFGLG